MVERRIVLFIHNLLSFRPGKAAIEAKVVKGKDAKSSYLPLGMSLMINTKMTKLESRKRE